MTITLSNAGKRFNREWIFRHIDYSFTANNTYAIIGANGSGKSTLLQLLAGSMHTSEGTIAYSLGTETIDPHSIYQQLAITAPYVELIEEMSAHEFLSFHYTFKPLLPTFTIDAILDRIALTKAAHKQIRYYSSGMKQRIKLAQAIFSDVPILLLDEPCCNLDATGYALYQELIKEYCTNRLIIVSSNDAQEYRFCNYQLPIQSFK